MYINLGPLRMRSQSIIGLGKKSTKDEKNPGQEEPVYPWVSDSSKGNVTSIFGILSPTVVEARSVAVHPLKIRSQCIAITKYLSANLCIIIIIIIYRDRHDHKIPIYEWRVLRCTLLVKERGAPYSLMVRL